MFPQLNASPQEGFQQTPGLRGTAAQLVSQTLLHNEELRLDKIILNSHTGKFTAFQQQSG